MIIVMLAATGFAQSTFFRQTIINFEALIVRDMVNALATQHGVTASDLESYTNAVSRRRLDQSFNSLRSLSDFVHIKVFVIVLINEVDNLLIITGFSFHQGPEYAGGIKMND